MKNWPSFGYFPYKGTYFRIHHENSNKQYADIPSIAVFYLLAELSDIEGESQNSHEFWKKGKSAIDNWNTEIKQTLEIPNDMIIASLDKYYWGNSVENEIYGLRIRINEKIFKDFLKERSEALKSVYQVSEYINFCKNIFTQKQLENHDFRNKMDVYTDKVKETASNDLSEISKSLQDLIKTTDNTREQIIQKMNRLIKEDKKPSYVAYTLIYLNELRLKASSLESLTSVGDFPGCISQMRGMIEGLTNNIFLDLLHMNFLAKYKEETAMELKHMFNEDSYKEALDYGIKVKLIDRKSALAKNKTLEGIAEHLQMSNDEIEKFIYNLHKKMSFASYLMLYGLKVSNSPLKDFKKNKLDKSKLWIFDPQEENSNILINVCLQEIKDALGDSGIHNEEKVDGYLDDIRKKIKEEKIILVPLMPTLSREISRYSVLTETSANGLREMYNEFSPFTHSTWETYTIWPFTSVLEIMTFKNNLKRFVEIMKQALEDYLVYFNKMIDSFFP